MMSLIVPPECLPLLREQRTHYEDVAAEYGRELAATFESISGRLPGTARRILDIGSGMAGIDVFLARRYPDAEIHLLDKQGVSSRINAGYNASADQFSHYNDFTLARELLRQNGVQNTVVCHDMRRDPFPDVEFDIVVSLLSWGFHYPIETYSPRCCGTLVVDVRRGTGGLQALSAMGAVSVVHEAEKYQRVVIRC